MRPFSVSFVCEIAMFLLASSFHREKFYMQMTENKHGKLDVWYFGLEIQKDKTGTYTHSS